MVGFPECLSMRFAPQLKVNLVGYALSFGLLWMCLVTTFTNGAYANSSESGTLNGVVIQLTNIQLGLNGVWKVGFPTRLAFDCFAESMPDSDAGCLGIACINTVDGEGISVVYEVPILSESCPEFEIGGIRMRRFETAIVHGRANRSIRISIKNPKVRENYESLVLVSNQPITADERNSASDSSTAKAAGIEILVRDDQRGQILPAVQPWIVGIGSDLGLDEVAQKSAQGRLPSYVSTELTDVSMLPVLDDGYCGVDLLVLPTNPNDIISKMTPPQQKAMVDWVRLGGHIQVWSGANTAQLSDWPWLKAILPAEEQGVAPDSDPGTIESFLSSQNRLGRLTLGRFTLRDGIVELIDRTKLPLLMRGSFGLGQVQLFAADLNTSPLKEWPERKLLLEKMLVDSIESPRKIQLGSSSQIALLGYDDLSGQLRAYLDVFPSVQNGNLLAMAAILALLVALIGPLDYFVIQRGFQRPTWTWWSLGLWSTLCIGLVIGMNSWWKPNVQLLNSVEIVDVDYSSQSLRGTAFFSQYVGNAGSYHVSGSARKLFSSPQTVQTLTTKSPSETSTVAPERKVPIRLNWLGQPGAGLGGFDSSVRTDFGYPSYRIGSGEVEQLGIPTAGTKSLRAQWSRGSLPIWPESKFEVLKGSDFLEGSWVNPLDEELLEPLLIYRGWIYGLPSKIRPGGEISIVANDIPKDLGRYLQQRQSTKDAEYSQPWDLTGGVSVDRLVDILGMHRAAGGIVYTGLTHRYIGRIDLSQTAYLNRAIIFGRLGTPIVELSLALGNEKLVNRNTNRSAFVRFILPVEVKRP